MTKSAHTSCIECLSPDIVTSQPAPQCKKYIPSLTFLPREEKALIQMKDVKITSLCKC